MYKVHIKYKDGSSIDKMFGELEEVRIEMNYQIGLYGDKLKKIEFINNDY